MSKSSITNILILVMFVAVGFYFGKKYESSKDSNLKKSKSVITEKEDDLDKDDAFDLQDSNTQLLNETKLNVVSIEKWPNDLKRRLFRNYVENLTNTSIISEEFLLRKELTRTKLGTNSENDLMELSKLLEQEITINEDVMEKEIEEIKGQGLSKVNEETLEKIVRKRLINKDVEQWREIQRRSWNFTSNLGLVRAVRFIKSDPQNKIHLISDPSSPTSRNFFYTVKSFYKAKKFEKFPEISYILKDELETINIERTVSCINSKNPKLLVDFHQFMHSMSIVAANTPAKNIEKFLFDNNTNCKNFDDKYIVKRRPTWLDHNDLPVVFFRGVPIVNRRNLNRGKVILHHVPSLEAIFSGSNQLEYK